MKNNPYYSSGAPLKKLNIALAILLMAFLLNSCAHTKTDNKYASDQTQYSSQSSENGSETVIGHNKLGQESFLLDNQTQNDATNAQFVNARQLNDRTDPEMTGPENPFKTDSHNNSITNIKKIQSHLDEALDYCQVAQDYWQKGELEKAIDALDQAYELILAVDIEDNPKLIQQKEDLRFMISRRILEIYASRNIVVTGNHNEIPITINKHVQKEIDLFTKGREKKFFEKSYQRSGIYRPYIVDSLKDAGLPIELSWLPLIESGYKVKALSKARALGLWQFIPSTGYKFGLKRDIYIDERLDPVKSTEAAIAYLKELHKLFGDWTTVLAAYNCGEGRVLRLIRKQNINYLDNFWDLYERLPLETARYVPRFLATLHIVNNPVQYGLDKIKLDSPLEYDTIAITKQIHLKDASARTEIPIQQLKNLNPELRYQILPPSKYSLRVPAGKCDVFLSKLDSLPVHKAPRNSIIYHRVRSGETLSVIAKRYRTSVRRIMRANNMRRSHYIVAGKKLKIPVGRTATVATARRPKKKFMNASTHKVRPGDSLWIIAKRYGTTTKYIQELNRLKSSNLYVGQVLIIRELKQADAAAKNNQKIYEVKSGDSPFKIAQRNKISLERLLQLNCLSSNSKIYPGQTLYID
jgi:membrane-bound lytic murein transglycosylase D